MKIAAKLLAVHLIFVQMAFANVDSDLRDAVTTARAILDYANDTLTSKSISCYNVLSDVEVDRSKDLLCRAGAGENSTNNFNGDRSSTQQRRASNLNEFCNSEEAQKNARVAQESVALTNRFFQADKFLEQDNENRLLMDLVNDDNFYHNYARISGLGLDYPAIPSPSLDMCVNHWRTYRPERSVGHDIIEITSAAERLELRKRRFIARACLSLLDNMPSYPIEPYCLPTPSTSCSLELNPSIPKILIYPCQSLSGNEKTQCEEAEYDKWANQPDESDSRGRSPRQIQIDLAQEDCDQHRAGFRLRCETARRTYDREYDRIDRIIRQKQSDHERCINSDETLKKWEDHLAASQPAPEPERPDAPIFEDASAGHCFGRQKRSNVRAICLSNPRMDRLSECGPKEKLVLQDYEQRDKALIAFKGQAANNAVTQLRNIFNYTFEGSKEKCLEKGGADATQMCEALEQDKIRHENRYENIYNAQRMGVYRSFGQGLVDDYKNYVNSLSISDEKKQKMLSRLDKISFVAPENPGAMDSVVKGYATCQCHAGSDQDQHTGHLECVNNPITLSPALMMRLQGASGQEAVRGILLHEIGHAVASDLNEGDPVFSGLSQCLSPSVNMDSVPDSSKRVLKMESVADWLSAQVLGHSLSSSSTPASEATNSMQFMMCGLLTSRPSPGSQNPCYLVEGRYRYWDDLPEGHSCSESSYGHPLPPDRFAIFARSSTLRSAVGCPSVNSGNGINNCQME